MSMFGLLLMFNLLGHFRTTKTINYIEMSSRINDAIANHKNSYITLQVQNLLLVNDWHLFKTTLANNHQSEPFFTSNGIATMCSLIQARKW